MYDTIRFNLQSKDVPSIKILDVVSPHLNFTQTVSEFGVTSHNFRLDNLYCKVSNSGLSVNSGSICKYLHGNNLVNFTCEDMKLATEKLSDTLHLPMENANVTKIDFAYNFNVSLPPESYYYHLGDFPYYKRLEQRNNGVEGLYYTSDSDKMKLVFYNKIKEYQKNKEVIPKEYEDRNLLRYEMRLLRHVNKRLGYNNSITLSTLYDEEFYRNLVELYKSNYFKIDKVNSLLPNFMEFSGYSGLKNIAMMDYIDRKGGIVEFFRMIDNQYERQLLSKRDRDEIKRQVKLLCNDNSTPIVPNTVIEELDTLVKSL